MASRVLGVFPFLFAPTGGINKIASINAATALPRPPVPFSNSPTAPSSLCLSLVLSGSVLRQSLNQVAFPLLPRPLFVMSLFARDFAQKICLNVSLDSPKICSAFCNVFPVPCTLLPISYFTLSLSLSLTITACWFSWEISPEAMNFHLVNIYSMLCTVITHDLSQI